MYPTQSTTLPLVSCSSKFNSSIIQTNAIFFKAYLHLSLGDIGPRGLKGSIGEGHTGPSGPPGRPGMFVLLHF